MKGFTLLEVLITVVIFSIGLLALAGLQVKGLQLAADSASKTTATLLANDIADRMRANVIVAELGLLSPYNNANQKQVGNPSCLGKNSAGADANTRCNMMDMAWHDFYEWYGSLNGRVATAWHPIQHPQLPSGAGIVCIDSTPNDGTPSDPKCDNILINPLVPIFTVKIWWHARERDANNQLRLQSYVMNVAI